MKYQSELSHDDVKSITDIKSNNDEIYDDSYTGDLNDQNERHGKGTSYYSNGSIEYSGHWKNNLKDSHGISYHKGTLTPVAEYEGVWENNKMHGKGKYASVNDTDIFDGEWVNNQPVNGTHTIATEKTVITGKTVHEYVGEFKNRKPHGKCKYMYNKQLIYDGDWIDGKLDGSGTYKLKYHKNNSKLKLGIHFKHFVNYTGTFSGGKMVKGTGETFGFKRTCSSRGDWGDYYNGDLLHGVPHGNGMCVEDITHYDIEDMDSKKWGYNNNFTSYYNGEFLNGKPYGKNKFIKAIYKCDACKKMDEYSTYKCKYNCGIYYVGNCVDGQINGECNVYAGSWGPSKISIKDMKFNDIENQLGSFLIIFSGYFQNGKADYTKPFTYNYNALSLNATQTGKSSSRLYNQLYTNLWWSGSRLRVMEFDGKTYKVYKKPYWGLFSPSHDNYRNMHNVCTKLVSNTIKPRSYKYLLL
jgi:hypothetical protein